MKETKDKTEQAISLTFFLTMIPFSLKQFYNTITFIGYSVAMGNFKSPDREGTLV